jgi:hypothetical protein
MNRAIPQEEPTTPEPLANEPVEKARETPGVHYDWMDHHSTFEASEW